MVHVLAMWQGDVMGLVILIVALLGVTVAQVGITTAAMWGMNKLVPEKLTDTKYGEFDFESFQQTAFNTFLTRLFVIYGAPTLLFNLAEYILIYRYINIYWGAVFLTLFILETAAICLGLFLIFHLDRFRLLVLTALSGLVYMIFFGFMSWLHLLI